MPCQRISLRAPLILVVFVLVFLTFNPRWLGRYNPYNGFLPPDRLCNKFSWHWSLPRTVHLECLIENALHRVWRQFIFNVWILTQEVSNLATPHRNNLIIIVSYFLQPRLGSLIPAWQSSFSVPDGLISIRIKRTPMPKASAILKDLTALCTIPVDFHICYSSKMNLPPYPQWETVSRPTNVRQPLKIFNRLVFGTILSG